MIASASSKYAVYRNWRHTFPSGNWACFSSKFWLSLPPHCSTAFIPAAAYIRLTYAALNSPPGLSPTTTSAPRAFSIRTRGHSTAGWVVTAFSGLAEATRFTLTAIFMPGSTQSSPPIGASTRSSASCVSLSS